MTSSTDWIVQESGPRTPTVEEVEEACGDVLYEIGNELLMNSDAVSSAIASTNACDFGLDTWEITEVQPTWPDYYVFRATLHFPADEHREAPFCGNEIQAEVNVFVDCGDAVACYEELGAGVTPWGDDDD